MQNWSKYHSRFPDLKLLQATDLPFLTITKPLSNELEGTFCILCRIEVNV